MKKSKFYPDGYYLHRSFWVGQNKLIDAHPKVIVAFTTAHPGSVAEAFGDGRRAASPRSVKKYWGLGPELGAKVVGDEVLFIRKWVWPTEGDVSAVLEVSKFMTEGRLIEKPLTWEQITQNIGKAAPLLKQAYERSGKQPATAEFTSADAKDLRGLPTWEQATWKPRG